MTRHAILMVAAMALGLFGICAPAVIPPVPRLIWNATASTPIGLYALRPAVRLRVSELVAVQPPAPIARYLASGGFLPLGVLLLKHIAALPGQTVCRVKDAITVDDIALGDAHDRDHLGRLLPRWSGCRTLLPGQVFLMNATVPDSLDGRYFGPFPATSIVARAVPIWAAEADGGRLIWRVVPR
jgi:conjugative transfer signal peptidase TraF